MGTDGVITYYAGSFVYTGSSLTYLQHPEGLYFPSSGGYHYFLKDHLGNTRMMVNTLGTGGTIVQQTDYYPFGIEIASYSSGVENRYRYNGKEKQNDLIGGKNLDWYDYGARFYDPMIGRWHTPDPLGEYTFNLTPYNYCNNNPLRYVDPFGLEAEETEKNKKTNYQNLLPEVTVHGKKPPWLMRMFNRVSRLFKETVIVVIKEDGILLQDLEQLIRLRIKPNMQTTVKLILMIFWLQ